MIRSWSRQSITALVLGLGLATLALGGEQTGALKRGTPDLKSAGPLGFGPDGVLFVGDTQGAALFAIDTGERGQAGDKKSLEIKDVAGKAAALLGTSAQQILVNDVAVSPITGAAYLAISRGRGPDAKPMILKATADGKLEEFSLENVPFARAELPNVPGADVKIRGQSVRSEAITDIAFADGRVFIAGLSNEEFSSRLIAIPYPFSDAGFDGASIEIYHGAHGQLETKSPIRTFVVYQLDGKPHMLAAYTCTPLVSVPVADLKAGLHVKGRTIAELGNRNRPLDMVVYQKDGKDYLLLANSSRGVMKIGLLGAGEVPPIKAPVKGTKGLGYDTITALKGVVQMDQLDGKRAVILAQDDASGALDLRTIDLP